MHLVYLVYLCFIIIFCAKHRRNHCQRNNQVTGSHVCCCLVSNPKWKISFRPRVAQKIKSLVSDELYYNNIYSKDNLRVYVQLIDENCFLNFGELEKPKVDFTFPEKIFLHPLMMQMTYIPLLTNCHKNTKHTAT